MKAFGHVQNRKDFVFNLVLLDFFRRVYFTTPRFFLLLVKCSTPLKRNARFFSVPRSFSTVLPFTTREKKNMWRTDQGHVLRHCYPRPPLKKLPKRRISLPQPCGPRLSSKTRGGGPPSLEPPLLCKHMCPTTACLVIFLLLCCSCVLFCYRFVWFPCGSAIMQRKVMHVNFFCFSCHICRNTVVLRTRNFTTMATWHNGLPSLLPFSSIIIAGWF